MSLDFSTNGNIQYIDEQTVLYPAGSNIVIHNQETKSQKFIHLTESSTGISAIAVNDTKKWLAVAEVGKHPTIVIHDLTSLKKRRIINAVETKSMEFISASFSGDAKYLLSLTGGPDWLLQLWSWDKCKLLASIRATGIPERTTQPGFGAVKANRDPLAGMIAYQCLINPFDSTQVSVIGNGIFKIFKFIEGLFKLTTAPKIEQRVSITNQNILTHCWIAHDRIMCASKDGKIMLFDSFGELKADFCHIDPSTQLRRSVRVIDTSTKGVVLGCDGGIVAVYERADELGTSDLNHTGQKDEYKFVRQFLVDDLSSNITKLAVSPNDDAFIAVNDTSQMYNGFLLDTSIKEGGCYLELLSDSFHFNQITGMDTCIRKPLVVTCSIDKTVRVWNYGDTSLDLLKKFPEESYSISIHPSGLYILVGFTHNLQLMKILIDDIEMYHEFEIPKCNECKFSNGGQYFAAATTNIIRIYSTWTFACINTISCSDCTFQTICWTSDDLQLITGGNDGTVRVWSLLDVSGFQGQGIIEVEKLSTILCTYTDVCVSQDSKTTYAICSDRTLKEIVAGKITKEIQFKRDPTKLAICYTSNLIMVGTKDGAVRVLQLPLTDDVEKYQEYQIHSGAITRLSVSFDDQYLFSVSKDGSFYIFQIIDRNGRISKHNKELTQDDEILVTKTDLEDINCRLVELKSKVEDLRTNHEFQLRTRDLDCASQIHELSLQFNIDAGIIDSKSIQNNLTKERNRRSNHENLERLSQDHNTKIASINLIHDSQVLVQLRKSQDLKVESANTQQQWEEEMNLLQAEHKQSLTEMNKYSKDRDDQKVSEIAKLREMMENESDQSNILTKETNDDADAEIKELLAKFEIKMSQEQSTLSALNTENIAMKVKMSAILKDVESSVAELSATTDMMNKLQMIILNHEKDITSLNKEERDDSIQDKENRIYDLITKNQELDKFKFVLDYKIEELNKEIEPRELEIHGLADTIKDLQAQSETEIHAISKLELLISDLKAKMFATEKEVRKDEEKIDLESALHLKYQIHLREINSCIDDPKLLKASIMKLYRMSYADNFTQSELDPQEQLSREEGCLERTLATLKMQDVRENKNRKARHLRLVDENVALVTEINELRLNGMTISQK